MPRLVKKNDRSLADRDIRLINSDNEQIGILPIAEALNLAQKDGLDLVVVAEQSDPPVCRFMNFGKYTFERNKRFREQKKKQKQSSQKNKEIKFHANIDPHDYKIKINHITTFLRKGYKVKVSLFFRGREMRNREFGMDLMNQVAEDIVDCGTLDGRPKMAGRNISMFLAPLSHK